VRIVERDYFRKLRDDPSAGTVITGRFRTYEGGELVFAVAKRRMAPSGQFNGIIATTIRPDVFDAVYQEASAPGRLATLWNSNGAVLSRYPEEKGREYLDLAPNAALRQPPAERGLVSVNSAYDHVPRVVAYQKLAGFDVYAAWGEPRPTFLSLVRGGLPLTLAGMLSLAAVIALAVAALRERRQVEAKIETRTAELAQSLAENKLLMRELHHRVKNNLQMMSSMVRIMGRKAPDASQPIFRDISQRIFTIGRIYDHLDKTGLKSLDLAAYLGDIVKQAVGTFRQGRVQLKTRIQPFIAEVDLALTLGLIVNELVTNALKHAFADGREGELLVRFETDGQQGVLTVRDNGPGLPETRRAGAAGLTLLSALAQQIEGRVHVKNRPEGGAQFRITFKLNPPHATRSAA
jgi:two-component sensor histidine kinase